MFNLASDRFRVMMMKILYYRENITGSAANMHF